MNQVTFDPTTWPPKDLERWERWKTRSINETKACIAAYGTEPPYKFKGTIWTALKLLLLRNVFHGKCGYCDSRVTHISSGAADHFRPKGRVRADVNGELQVMKCGESAHPGYYWLVYEWSNLIPACESCNSGGKSDRFPIEGTYACDPDVAASPENLDEMEKPLLLHPYRDDPSQFLVFDADTAIVGSFGDNLRGNATIEAFGLNRADLVQERKRTQDSAWEHYLFEWVRGEEQRRAAWNEYAGGSLPFAAAAMARIKSQYEAGAPRNADS